MVISISTSSILLFRYIHGYIFNIVFVRKFLIFNTFSDMFFLFCYLMHYFRWYSRWKHVSHLTPTFSRNLAFCFVINSNLLRIMILKISQAKIRFVSHFRPVSGVAWVSPACVHSNLACNHVYHLIPADAFFSGCGLGSLPPISEVGC